MLLDLCGILYVVKITSMTTESEKKSLYIENRAALLERTLSIVAEAKRRKVFHIPYKDGQGKTCYLEISIDKIKAIADCYEQDLIAECCGIRAHRIRDKFQEGRKP